MGVRARVQTWLRFPAWVYQRQRALWDRAILAGGWTWLYWLCSGVEAWLRLSAERGAGDAVALLPEQWRIVMAALVFVLGMWRPVAGYVAFIVAVAYPLYLVSVYVMALALAVLILLAPVMALYADRGVLYLAALVLLTVALAPLHLAPLVPLLAGLWWQGAGSWIGGGVAALWLKVCAAVSGHSVDLWSLFGWAMHPELVYERFHAANSMQTVAFLLQPFGIRLAAWVRGAGLETEWELGVSPGVYVLFNLLQVCAWAAAAFAVSAVLDRLSERWAGKGRAGLRAVLSVLPGLLLIWAGFVALPTWLGVEGPRWLDPPWLLVQIGWLGLAAWGLDGLLRYLNRPVSLKADVGSAPSRDVGRESRWGARSVGGKGTESVSPRVRRPLAEDGRWGVRTGRRESREQASEQSSDIMIELD
jgi:hypothetical protein